MGLVCKSVCKIWFPGSVQSFGFVKFFVMIRARRVGLVCKIVCNLVGDGGRAKTSPMPIFRWVFSRILGIRIGRWYHLICKNTLQVSAIGNGRAHQGFVKIRRILNVSVRTFVNTDLLSKMQFIQFVKPLVKIKNLLVACYKLPSTAIEFLFVKPFVSPPSGDGCNGFGMRIYSP